jgi:glycosyltransferase involved in cell wall biosynthesis
LLAYRRGWRKEGLLVRDVYVVVPMHNEAPVIAGVVAGLLRSFPHVVCVDDGSTDACGDIARNAGATVLRHPTNLGQGAALQTGISFALGRPGTAYVVTFDADGQHDPADAVRMVELARADAIDVVLGSRFLEASGSVPGLRRALLRGGVAFTRLTTGLRLTDTHNGLRVLSRRAARDLDIRLRGMAHASELLQHVADEGLSYREVPVSIRYTEYSRAKGQSGLNALNIVFDLFVDRLYAS